MRKQTSFLLAAIILLVASFLTSANATQRTFRFNGTISTSTVTGISVGDAFVATLSYDDAQAPSSSGSNYAFYNTFTFELTISGMIATTGPSDQLFVNLNSGLGDIFQMFSSSSVAQFRFISDPGTVFSSTALPSTLTLTDFYHARVYWVPSGTVIAYGDITSITDLTPTPGLCPQPQGDWKNNPDWPVAELKLGSQTYSQSALVNILNMPVGRGNDADASLILAKQLIAAKLNIANGVEASEEVQDAIDSADELIGSATIPMSVGPRTTSGKQMTGVAGFLESYNKGELTEGCSLAKSGVTGDNEITQLVPDVYVLDQNYPNPFNPSTMIGFQLPVTSDVKLTIYNTAGQLVRTLVNGEVPAGSHAITWDATDNSGERVASGMYLCVIKAGEFTAQRKLVLMK